MATVALVSVSQNEIFRNTVILVGRDEREIAWLSVSKGLAAAANRG